MTQIAVRGDLVAGVIAACKLMGVPFPTTSTISTGALVEASSVIEWTPDLSPVDLATVTSIVKLAVGATLVTKAERDTLEPFLATGRTFQQLSQADFIDLAQNARDRQLFDNVTALWRVIRMFLRD